MGKIDFILTWVDGSDPKWQKEYQKFVGDKKINFAHYRDYGTLKYWFRMVEQFAPWVNKIHFVTCGQVPDWLDQSNPKLNIVNHTDFIPSQYLPTFSANPIELNLHRIEGLSEQFVYFNDDTFITAPVKPQYFFKKGLPCDSMTFSSLIPSVKNEVITYIMFNDLLYINSHFSKKKSLKSNFLKYFSFKYGKKLLKNLYYAPIGKFSGFENPHLPNSFLKSTFEAVWDTEREMLDSVCKNKFRTKEDVNQYLMRYWQLANGNFSPRSSSLGKNLTISTDTKTILKCFKSKNNKLLCVNDDPNISDTQYYEDNLLKIFEDLFPNKSKFEI